MSPASPALSANSAPEDDELDFQDAVADSSSQVSESEGTDGLDLPGGFGGGNGSSNGGKKTKKTTVEPATRNPGSNGALEEVGSATNAGKTRVRKQGKKGAVVAASPAKGKNASKVTAASPPADSAEIPLEEDSGDASPTSQIPTPTPRSPQLPPMTASPPLSSSTVNAATAYHSADHDSPWTSETSLSPVPYSTSSSSELDSQPPSTSSVNGTESKDRHFSLKEPETPTSSYHNGTADVVESPEEDTVNGHSSFSNSSANQQHENQSLAGAIWRNSALVSGLPGGGSGKLVEVSLEEEERREKRRTVIMSKVKPKVNGNDEDEDEGDLESYQFLLQRLEAQNTAIQTDPKARQSVLQTNSKMKASFDRLQRESEEEAGLIDWDFWGAVMSNYEEVASTQPRELSKAIQQGIPSALRGMTWQLMAASKDQDLEYAYSALLKQTSPHEKSIRRDLSRTFPKNEYFADPGGAGQENLFNVVKAYSLYDEEVGYTQGLQFIVGPLLLNMPDEEAFCVLVRLMKSYDLRSHYTPNMPGLQLRLFQFDRLLEELLPGVFMHLLRQGVKSSMYASQWFLTLFGYRFPLELVCSVFDLVFAEGVEAIFRFSVAILKRHEDKICEMSFDHLIEYLKNGLFESYAPDAADLMENPDALYKAQEFVREALQVKITPLMLDQFGEEWENLCRQQNAHTVEIETLRRANAQLSSQVRSLESSLSQINLEHCDLVRQVVMSKIEREELEDELVKYKIAFADLSHQQASDGAGSRHSQGNQRDWNQK